MLKADKDLQGASKCLGALTIADGKLRSFGRVQVSYPKPALHTMNFKRKLPMPNISIIFYYEPNTARSCHKQLTFPFSRHRKNCEYLYPGTRTLEFGMEIRIIHPAHVTPHFLRPSPTLSI
jgi:hypothetical protein